MASSSSSSTAPAVPSSVPRYSSGLHVYNKHYLRGQLPLALACAEHILRQEDLDPANSPLRAQWLWRAEVARLPEGRMPPSPVSKTSLDWNKTLIRKSQLALRRGHWELARACMRLGQRLPIGEVARGNWDMFGVALEQQAAAAGPAVVQHEPLQPSQPQPFGGGVLLDEDDHDDSSESKSSSALKRKADDHDDDEGEEDTFVPVKQHQRATAAATAASSASSPSSSSLPSEDKFLTFLEQQNYCAALRLADHTCQVLTSRMHQEAGHTALLVGWRTRQHLAIKLVARQVVPALEEDGLGGLE